MLHKDQQIYEYNLNLKHLEVIYLSNLAWITAGLSSRPAGVYVWLNPVDLFNVQAICENILGIDSFYGFNKTIESKHVKPT